MPTATRTDEWNGECRATADTVRDYLLAYYDVNEPAVDQALAEEKEFLRKGMLGGWLAWDVGDKIAWPRKWPYLESRDA